MLLKEQYFYFFNNNKKRLPVDTTKVRTFCRKAEYEAFLLVTAPVLNKLVHEPEVQGFSLIHTFKEPVPVYCVALNTTKIQNLLNKYEIEGLSIHKENTGVLKYGNNDTYHFGRSDS